MLFNSYDFIFGLLPLTLWAHHRALRRGAHAASVVLVIASLVYYGWWSFPNLLLFIASMLANFQLGVMLSDDRRADATRATILWVGLLLDLGLLGLFKYAGFVGRNLEAVLGVNLPVPELELPPGISFYTFQQIAYLVDARRGLTKEHDIWDYMLFVSFFPQLIAGPIVHHADVLPQFREGKAPTMSDRAVGATFFAAGLAKKLLVADMLAPLVETMFGGVHAGKIPTFWVAWEGLLAWHFQLYFDFSGYSDMAIGLGRMFGIRLPINFEAPYRSTSLSEFWRRWHLTLSTFLRDYLYFPLGGNRLGPTRTQVNLFLTLFLAGIWHGAGWTYILWGVQMGFYVVLHNKWREWTGGLPENAWGTAVGRIVTWFLLIASWPMFRGMSVGDAMVIYKAMFGFSPEGWGRPIVPLMLAFAALTVWSQVMPTLQQVMRLADPAHNWKPIDEMRWSDARSWHLTTGWAVAFGVLFVACVPVIDRAAAFLYWQF